MNGFVRIDGLTIPIDSVQLLDGGVMIRYTLTGLRRELNGPVTVFGADGKGCWQGRVVKIGPQRHGERWICNYKMTISDVAGANEGDELNWGLG